MKVGRNDLCPCGSGKKFKKCHLALSPGIFVPVRKSNNSPPPNLIRRAREQFERERKKREEHIAKYGAVLPIMHVPDFHGKPLVAVGSTFYQPRERGTFTNFLFDHGLGRFGDEWLDEQNSLPLDSKHPLFVMHWKAQEFVRTQTVRPEGYVTVKPNGPLSFCETFYHDLYTVAHNSDIDEDFMTRLRNRDQFQGAAHELFVEATCLRAGFSIIHEKDSTRKNAELIAVHMKTGQHVAVEAKSRHRDGVMGRPGNRQDDPDTRFGGLINNAIQKDPNNPLAIFVDTNLPADKAHRFYAPISREPVILSERISRYIHKVRSARGGVDPYNVLVFTNHSQHYSEDDKPPPGDHWAAFISDKPRVPVFSESALRDLLNALDLYRNVPTDFPKLIPGTNIPE
jgi:hypothetical protein